VNKYIDTEAEADDDDDDDDDSSDETSSDGSLSDPPVNHI